MISTLAGIVKSRMTIGDFLDQKFIIVRRIYLLVGTIVHEQDG